jgi:hypothetical protein
VADLMVEGNLLYILIVVLIVVLIVYFVRRM